MARKKKVDNIHSLFKMDENEEYLYLVGGQYVSGSQSDDKRGNGDELRRSDDANLGVYGVSEKSSDAAEREQKPLLGDDGDVGELSGNRHEQRSGRGGVGDVGLFAGDTGANAGASGGSERSDGQRESDLSDEARTGHESSQSTNNLDNDALHQAAIFAGDDVRDLYASGERRRGAEEVFSAGGDSRGQGREHTGIGAVRNVAIPNGDTSSLGDAASEYGDDRRYTDEKQLYDAGLGAETGIRASASGASGDGSVSQSASQADERDGQYGFGDIQSAGSGYIQGIPETSANGLSNGRDQSESISLLDDNEQETEISDFVIQSTGTNIDYEADINQDTAKIGKKQKFRNNIEAIKLAKELYAIKQKALAEQKNFTITKEEQQILSKFSGWGGISEAFDERKDDWTNEYKELKALLSDDEYKQARASTTSAFYTPNFIVDTMYKAVNRIGLNLDNNTKKVLEPSAGNGVFLSRLDHHHHGGYYKFDTAEIEPISNKFLNLLYPSANVFSSEYGFQDIKISNKTKYDLVIGNPPYANIRILDKDNVDISGMMIHNYFANKSMKHLKDNGIMALVITHNFLDNPHSKAREKLGEHSTFLGAVRLPNTAFKDEAKTEIVTDIVFFQKSLRNKRTEKDFISVSEAFDANGKSYQINTYFKENPQNVLGKLEVVSSQFGFELTCKEDPDINLQQALDEFIARELPEKIYEYSHNNEENENELYVSKFNKEYQANFDYFENLKTDSFVIFGNEIYRKRQSPFDGEALFEKEEIKAKSDEIKVRNFIAVRDARQELFNLEKQDIADDDPLLTESRRNLNVAYKNYHNAGYFFNDGDTNKIIRTDPSFHNVATLEANFNKGIPKQKAKKQGIEAILPTFSDAPVLSQRVLRPTPEIVFDNVKDGLFASMNKFGIIDTGYIALKLDKEQYQVEKELMDKNLIFRDPATEKFVFAPKYLTGNVKEKLKIAREAAKTEPKFYHNIRALEEVVPEDIPAHNITANIGANWIPLKYYQEFFANELDMNKDHVSVSLNKISGAIELNVEEWRIPYNTVQKFGYFNQNSRRSKKVTEIAQYALSGSSPKIMKDTDEPILNPDGSIKTDRNGNVVFKKVLDVVATQEVQRKADLFKNDFEEWIFKDFSRRMDLTKIYNDKFNCYVRKHYDGEYLKINGINQAFELRKHQKDAVARAINEKVVLLDHEVGAGKTLTAICSVMEQKKLGIINKPLIVVPNHLVEQWQKEFINAYPDANLLVADEKSMDKFHRDEFLAKIANGNYDAIIMKYTQLERIPVPVEIEERIIEEQKEELEEAIRIREENGGSKLSVKRLEAALEKLEAKLTELYDNRQKTKMIDFSELGVDCMVVDESHSFKNLQFSTALDNVKGLGNPTGSKRAMDLFMKTTYLHDQPNGKVMFLTGTPVSNSLSELYLLQKYLAPNELKEQGLFSFDSWVKTYGQLEKVFETGAVPNDYKVVNRFTSFNNLQSLGGSYLDFADIVTNAEIKKFSGAFVPEAEIITSKSKKSDEVARYIGVEIDKMGNYNEGSIVWRMERMKDADPRQDNILKCTNDAKKACLDFRLINPAAEDDPNSKINKCVENILSEYEAYSEYKGTQLVFLDIGTPKSISQLSKNINLDDDFSKEIEPAIVPSDEFVNINESLSKQEEPQDFSDDEIIGDRDANEKTFFLYGDIYKKLVQKGIPREEIAFIHDAKTNKEKQELFDKVNSGEIRVLIGSTAKMGAGTNVQERVTAIHHLDVPWKPSDLTQRNGRVIRQGNKIFENDPQNFKIKDFRYVTTETYDETSWQIVTSKAKAILNFRTGVLDGNSLDGFEDEAISCEVLKAISSGNPLILTNVKISTELEKLEREKKSYEQNQQLNEDNLARSEAKCKFLTNEISTLLSTKEYVANFENKDGLACSMFQNNVFDKTKTPVSFFIPKDDSSREVKIEQENMRKIFSNNVNLMFDAKNTSIDFCEYKGFVVSGYYDPGKREVAFELTNKQTKEVFSPSNLVFLSGLNKEHSLFEKNLKDQINMVGFFSRLNNYINKIDENIERNRATLANETKKLGVLKDLVSNQCKFPNTALLRLLREEQRICFEEIEKKKGNKEYVSQFTSKALSIIEAQRKSKQPISQQPVVISNKQNTKGNGTEMQ